MAGGRRRELRCYCGRKPLLAMYGTDDKGRTYLHVKIYKQSRIFGEILYYGGEVKLRCRECLRWNRILFVNGVAKLSEDAPPQEIASTTD